MVNTKKFSAFVNVTPATISDANEKLVGLENGVNMQSTRFLTWDTAGRPPSPFNGLLGFNTDLQQYEFWDADILDWTQLEDSGDIADVFARLASHAVGEGASLIGLQNQSGVTNKTVQDLANERFIVQVNAGSLQNAQALGSLTTGIVKNTTGTGVLSISAPLTSIDGLTLVANDMLRATGPATYAVIAPGNSSVLISGPTGIPSWSQTLPTTVQNNITQLGTQVQQFSMGGFNIVGLPAVPSGPTAAASKAYVDSVAIGLNVQAACYAATTAALTATYNNVSAPPSGVGATLTNSGALAAFSVDSVSPPLNSRILVKDQGAQLQNGIYTVTTVGSGAVAWVLTRATDYDDPSDVQPGDFVTIINGTVNSGSGWVQTNTVNSIGVDSIAWQLFLSGQYAKKGANNDITSMTGLTGVLQAPTFIADSNSNELIGFTSNSPVADAYFRITNDISAVGAHISVVGTDASFRMTTAGTGSFIFTQGTSNTTNPVIFRPNTAGGSEAIFTWGTLTANRTYTYPNQSGTIQLVANTINIIKRQILTSTGTYTPDANLIQAFVELQAPGGGSGGTTGAGGQLGLSGAGGGGAMRTDYIQRPKLGQTPLLFLGPWARPALRATTPGAPGA